MPEKLPDGWWELYESGLRDGVIAKVKARADIPEPEKAAIVAEIERLAASFNFVTVTAGYRTHFDVPNAQKPAIAPHGHAHIHRSIVAKFVTV